MDNIRVNCTDFLPSHCNNTNIKNNNTYNDKNKLQSKLQDATIDNNMKMVELLVYSNGSITITSKENGGWSPIYSAVWNNNIKMTNFLLQHGADINTINVDGCNLLHRAILNNNLDMVKFLINKGANVNVPSRYCNISKEHSIQKTYERVQECTKDTENGKRYPLNTAVIMNDLDLVRVLLENKANPNQVENSLTPLQIAIKYKHIRIIQCLLNYGVDRTLPDINKIPYYIKTILETPGPKWSPNNHNRVANDYYKSIIETIFLIRTTSNILVDVPNELLYKIIAYIVPRSN